MSTPRCGVSDHVKHIQESKWQKNDLTYRFDNFTPDMEKYDIRSITAKAFKYWCDVTPLKVAEKTLNDFPDIVLQ